MPASAETQGEFAVSGAPGTEYGRGRPTLLVFSVEVRSCNNGGTATGEMGHDANRHCGCIRRICDTAGPAGCSRGLGFVQGGYDRFKVQLRGKPTAGCRELLRESLRASGTRGNLAALVNGHSRSRVCVGGLLELSEEELAGMYARWAKREHYEIRGTLPAEMLINLVLMDKYTCRTGNIRPG